MKFSTTALVIAMLSGQLTQAANARLREAKAKSKTVRSKKSAEIIGA